MTSGDRIVVRRLPMPPEVSTPHWYMQAGGWVHIFTSWSAAMRSADRYARQRIGLKP